MSTAFDILIRNARLRRRPDSYVISHGKLISERGLGVS